MHLPPHDLSHYALCMCVCKVRLEVYHDYIWSVAMRSYVSVAALAALCWWHNTIYRDVGNPLLNMCSELALLTVLDLRPRLGNI